MGLFVQDHNAKEKALQSISSMSSAQIVSATAIHSKLLPGMVRASFPGNPQVTQTHSAEPFCRPLTEQHLFQVTCRSGFEDLRWESLTLKHKTQPNISMFQVSLCSVVVFVSSCGRG